VEEVLVQHLRLQEDPGTDGSSSSVSAPIYNSFTVNRWWRWWFNNNGITGLDGGSGGGGSRANSGAGGSGTANQGFDGGVVSQVYLMLVEVEEVLVHAGNCF
jgi:hypothetical protein